MADSKEEKKEILINAARDVLAKYGFKKVTLEDIAEKAGLAKTSVYHYFNSKEEILTAVIRRELNRLLNRMRNAVEKKSTSEKKLIGLVKERYVFLQEMKSLTGSNMDILQEVGPMVRAERDRFLGAEMELLKEVILDGIARDEFFVEDPELLALVAISALRGIDDTFMMYGKHERITEGIEGMMNLLTYGFRKR